MNFSCCVDMMYPGLSLRDKILATRSDLVGAIEFWRLFNKDLDRLRTTLNETGTRAVLCNLDSRDENLSAALMRGILSHRRTDDFVAAIHGSAPEMRKLGIKNAIVLAGDVDSEIGFPRALENIRETLRIGVKAAENEGIGLVLEPLNTYDRAPYVLPYSRDAFDIVRDINSPALKVLLDLYHTQRMEGNLIYTLEREIDFIGHFHVANSPYRCEPDFGEVDYRAVFDAIEKSGYNGYVGFEYRQKNAGFSLGEWINGGK